MRSLSVSSGIVHRDINLIGAAVKCPYAALSRSAVAGHRTSDWVSAPFDRPALETHYVKRDIAILQILDTAFMQPSRHLVFRLA
jgi:hypothetical protein